MKSDVIVLFSGSPDQVTANWVNRDGGPAEWPVVEGALVARHEDIITRQKFTDFQLHVEWREPYMPYAHGQARGNSGVGLQGRYEIQVLDSYGITNPGNGQCGAVYGQSAPLFNACKPPRQWQTYDIAFRAPRFDADGKKLENARVSVVQNGITVQNNQEIPGTTGIDIDHQVDQPGPILLQYHGCPMAFRNVWIRPLPLQGAAGY